MLLCSAERGKRNVSGSKVKEENAVQEKRATRQQKSGELCRSLRRRVATEKPRKRKQGLEYLVIILTIQLA